MREKVESELKILSMVRTKKGLWDYQGQQPHCTEGKSASTVSGRGWRGRKS